MPKSKRNIHNRPKSRPKGRRPTLKPRLRLHNEDAREQINQREQVRALQLDLAKRRFMVNFTLAYAAGGGDVTQADEVVRAANTAWDELNVLCPRGDVTYTGPYLIGP